MKILRKNDTGEAVKDWQLVLIEKGFKIEADGEFGIATETATRTFQAQNNLRADGIVGDATRSAARNPTVKPAAKPTRNRKTILLSAGHTTNPKGDRGMAGNGYIEGVEAVKLRDAVAESLRNQGFSVIEDGSDGISDPLTKAIALARNATLAIEFHFNAGPPTANGIEVLCKPNKKNIAKLLASGIREATGFSLRGEKGWKSDSSGQHHRLGFCQAGGLIVEVCFMSNKSEIDTYKAKFNVVVEYLAEAIAGA